jgi:hypothetical protein
MGIETLLAHGLVPEGLPACSKGPAKQQIHHIWRGEQNSNHIDQILPFPFWRVSVGRRRSPSSGEPHTPHWTVHRRLILVVEELFPRVSHRATRPLSPLAEHAAKCLTSEKSRWASRRRTSSKTYTECLVGRSLDFPWLAFPKCYSSMSCSMVTGETRPAEFSGRGES